MNNDLLINWLNKEIVLSKIIKDIPMDFRNGYLFAELLHKTKLIPNLSIYLNSNKEKDIIHNFCFCILIISFHSFFLLSFVI